MPTSKPNQKLQADQLNRPSDGMINTQKSIPLKSLLISSALVLLLTWLGTLPHWLQQPFIPLDRTDMRQSNGIEAALQPVTHLYSQLGKPVVIALYRPGCLCNWVSKRHEAQIEAFAAKKNLLFQRIDASHLRIPSTPALLILDETGSVRYFGAYGFGAFCSKTSIGYAQQQLTLMLNDDRPPPLYNLLGSGCYCRQPTLTEGLSQ